MEQGDWNEDESCICRDPTDLCLDFLIVFFSSPKCQYLTNWDETQQSAIFLALLRTSRTNPTDSTLKFISLWIMLRWSEVQLVLLRAGQKKCLSKRYFLFFILRVHFQSLYFLTLTWVKKLNLNFNFYQSWSSPFTNFQEKSNRYFQTEEPVVSSEVFSRPHRYCLPRKIKYLVAAKRLCSGLHTCSSAERQRHGRWIHWI